MFTPTWLSRYTESYSTSQQLFEKRTAAGQHPNFPLTSDAFLFWANALYLVSTFVLYRYMTNRKEPFKCKAFKSILLVYNFTCVVLAGYVVWGLISTMITVRYSFVCNQTVLPGSDEDKGHAAFVAHIFWVFYIQKFWEFLDTFFFILRKSFRQVTFLHVFHHCSINIVVGILLRHEFNGDGYLPILLNALVHFLMYSHYLASAIGLATPWKPWLTSLQLTQFVLIASQNAISLSRGDSCGSPYFLKLAMVGYMASMLLLFCNFFFHAYLLKKPSTRFGSGVIKHLEPLYTTKSHRGRTALDAEGTACIGLPPSFCVEELHYTLTPIGKPMPNLHVSKEPQAEDNNFTLAGGVPHMLVSWTVTMEVALLGEPPAPKPVLSCCAENSQDPQGSCCSSSSDKKEQ